MISSDNRNGDTTGGPNRAEGHSDHSDQIRPKLPRLLRLADRVAAFSPECEVCRSLQSRISDLGANVAGRRRARENSRIYLRAIKGIARHLKRTHRLVEEKQYVKRYVSMGLCFGLSLIVLSLILTSFGITLLALNMAVLALFPRVIFGYTIGSLLDKRSRKRGRVI